MRKDVANPCCSTVSGARTGKYEAIKVIPQPREKIKGAKRYIGRGVVLFKREKIPKPMISSEKCFLMID